MINDNKQNVFKQILLNQDQSVPYLQSLFSYIYSTNFIF